MPHLCSHSDHHVILRVCMILAVLCVSHLPCARCALSLLPGTSCIRSIMGLACSWTVCLCCIYVEAGFACGCYAHEPFWGLKTEPIAHIEFVENHHLSTYQRNGWLLYTDTRIFYWGPVDSTLLGLTLPGRCVHVRAASFPFLRCLWLGCLLSGLS